MYISRRKQSARARQHPQLKVTQSSPVITSVSATAAAVGPSSSPTECGSSSLKTKFAMFNVPKRNCDNGVTPGKQETVKGRILQMAEEEHEKKNENFGLKRGSIRTKKKESCSNNLNHAVCVKNKRHQPVTVLEQSVLLTMLYGNHLPCNM